MLGLALEPMSSLSLSDPALLISEKQVPHGKPWCTRQRPCVCVCLCSCMCIRHMPESVQGSKTGDDGIPGPFLFSREANGLSYTSGGSWCADVEWGALLVKGWWRSEAGKL